MPYRSFKHLLGETTLERKCRFISGVGILTAVVLSLYWTGQKAESLIVGQTTQTARMLVEPTLMNFHSKLMGSKDVDSLVDAHWTGVASFDDMPRYEPKVISPSRRMEGQAKPPDEFEQAALARFLRAASAEEAYREAGSPRRPYRFGDGTPTWSARILPGEREYQYVQAVLFRPACLTACHGAGSAGADHLATETKRSDRGATAKAGDLAGVVSIRLKMEDTNKAINRNRAILITAALVTTCSTMFVSYLGIRVLISRPSMRMGEI